MQIDVWLQDVGVEAVAEQIGVLPRVLAGLLIAWLAIIAGTIVRLSSLALSHDRPRGDLLVRLAGWWLLLVLFTVAVVTGPIALAILFGCCSLIAVNEFVGLMPRPQDRTLLRGWAIIATLAHYTLIVLEQVNIAIVLTLIALPLFVAIHLMLRKRTEGFVGAVGEWSWGMLLSVVAVSHVPMLLYTPSTNRDQLGGMGWLLFVVLLTELTDISQALWGRISEGPAVAHEVSPNKQWSGTLCGVATTIGGSVILAPLLLPRQFVDGELAWWCIVVAFGAVIGFGAVAGDLVVSAVKRDRGVKDAGWCVPGQGGMLDRLDSLTITAPLGFYSIMLLEAMG